MADSSSAKKTAAPPRSKQGQKDADPQRTKKLLVVIAMLVCCAGSFYFFRTTMDIIENNESALNNAQMPSAPDPATETEKQEIESAETGLTNLSKASSQAMRVALLAEVQSRYPLDLPVTLVSNASVNVEYVEIVEPDPPMLEISAILITGSDKIAMVTVDGGSEMLIRQGAKFSDSNGITATVTKILAKEVEFKWRGKTHRVLMP
jgi:hypothetical protein